MTAKIPKAERDVVREQLYFIADRLKKNCKLTAEEALQVIYEVLGDGI